MDKNNALTLMESLLERLVRDERSGRWQLQGVISEKERQALKWAFKSIGGSEEFLVSLDSSVAAEAKSQSASRLEGRKPVPIDTTCLNLDSPEDSEVILCLDFGTAMSKAFATRANDSNLLDLAIGRRAGQTNPIYALHSSVYIAPSGKIYFGEHAIRASLEGKTAGLKRFDSPKDILCKGITTDLDDAQLEAEFNPTGIPLTKGDLVTLYLAFLTDMAVTELEERHNSSRYVRRRFTRPVLPPERALWAEEELTKLLARSQIVADTFHGQWEGGIDAAVARETILTVRNGDQTPTFLIQQGVIEPVAAVGSRVRDFVPDSDKRRLVMVIDAGAGTIDFAMFVERMIAGEGARYYTVPASIKVLRQAGDVVDKVLQRVILEKTGIPTTDPDYNRLNAGLSLQIRPLKETLFRTGTTNFLLDNDAIGVVSRTEFLESDGIIEFGKRVRAKFSETLNSVPSSWYQLVKDGQIPIYFTGGGAQLPMVQALGRVTEIAGGRPVQFAAAVPTPNWITRGHKDLEPEYLQLAVAIGGASRNLPEVAPHEYDEFGGLDVESWEIKPAYKGEDKL